jgi:hypothetical protein
MNTFYGASEKYLEHMPSLSIPVIELTDKPTSIFMAPREWMPQHFKASRKGAPYWSAVPYSIYSEHLTVSGGIPCTWKISLWEKQGPLNQWYSTFFPPYP